jgi:FkbM family methyltransferase
MNSALKKIKVGLQRILLAGNYRVMKADTVFYFEPLLLRHLRQNPDFFFVEIGANDGIFHDAIHSFVTREKVRGLVVEPLPDVFDELVKNYHACPGIIPVRTAIHRSLKSVTLHRPDPARLAQLGASAKGVGSLDRDWHKRADVPDDCMITETVPAMTLAELLEKYSVTRLDLLQIDAEGYDAEIIKMLDTLPVRPAIIRFEHGLSDGIMTKAAFMDCVEFLVQRDYYVLMEKNDAIACGHDLLYE